jgi:signal transduction histidine kinase
MADQAAAMTGRISARMEEMMGLIEDMLDLAKAKAGGPMGEVCMLDLRDEARAQCERHRPQGEQKGLEMHLAVPDEPACVRFDSRGLALVVSKLVSNAVKYTPAGSVRIEVSRADGRAVLRVADTGIGILAGDVAKLFRGFYRASNAKRQRIGGSGVGLALVKLMVERFGGRLTLDSRENEGSTFTVQLPLAEQGEGSRA